MNYRNKVAKSIPYTMSVSLLKVFIAVLIMKYVIDYLSPIEYAALGTMMSFVKLSNMFTSFGYNHYITRYLPAIKENKKAGDITWNIIAQRLGRVLIFCIILYFMCRVLGKLNQAISGYEYHVRVFIPIILFNAGSSYLRMALNARFLQKQIFFLDLFFQITRVVCILIIMYLKAPFIFLIYGYVICEGINFVFSVVTFSVKNSWPGFNNIFWRRKENIQEKKYRRISYINDLGTSFLDSDINKWILGVFSTAMQVSIYTLATGILEKLLEMYPIKMLRPLAEPVIYGKHDDEKGNKASESLNKMFQLLYNANNYFGFLSLALFLPLGKDLMLLFFKRDYTAEAYWPLIIFMFFIVVYSVPLGIVSKAIEKPHILLLAKLAVVVNLLLGIPLVMKYGAIGMAIASVLSIGLKNAIIYISVKKHIYIRIPWNATGKCMLNVLITVAFLFFMKNVLGIGKFSTYLDAEQILLVTLGMIVYVIIFKFNSNFNLEQKEILFSILPKKAKRIAMLII